MQVFSMRLIRKWCEQRNIPVKKEGTAFVAPIGKRIMEQMQRPRFRRYMSGMIAHLTIRERRRGRESNLD
jgi:hypothetical protein